MLSKFAATVLLSIVVFIVATLLVSLGVLWWTGDSTRGVRIGAICGSVAVFAVGAANWYGRSGGRSGDEHERSEGGRDRLVGLRKPSKNATLLSIPPTSKKGVFSEVLRP
jgi:Na+/proline symporter